MSWLLALLFSLTASAAIESGGEALVAYRSYLENDPNPPAPYQSSNSFVRVEPWLQWAGEDTRFRLKLTGLSDQTESQISERTVLIPQELFIETRKSWWSAWAGLNTVTWGVSDIVNPLDVVNPRFARNPLSPLKIGSAGLANSFNYDSGSFTFIYIPRQFPHRLPTTSSRTWPRQASFGDYYDEFRTDFQGEPVVVRLPQQPLNFTIEKEDDLNHALDNNLAAQWKQTVGSAEFQVVGFEGLPTFPDFSGAQVSPTVIQFPPPSYVLEISSKVTLIPKYERVRIAGFGTTYQWTETLFKLAYADTWKARSDGLAISLPQTLVLGLEQAYSIRKLSGAFLLQHHQINDRSTAPSSVYSTHLIFDQSLLVSTRLAKDLDWSFLVGVMLSPRQKGQVLSFDGQYRVNDRMQLKLAAQSLKGEERTLLNDIQSLSNVEAGLLLYW